MSDFFKKIFSLFRKWLNYEPPLKPLSDYEEVKQVLTAEQVPTHSLLNDFCGLKCCISKVYIHNSQFRIIFNNGKEKRNS